MYWSYIIKYMWKCVYDIFDRQFVVVCTLEMQFLDFTNRFLKRKEDIPIITKSYYK